MHINFSEDHTPVLLAVGLIPLYLYSCHVYCKLYNPLIALQCNVKEVALVAQKLLVQL